MAEHGPFDIVLDDGGHHVDMQVVTFDELWPSIAPGGVFMVEDTFSSYVRKLGGGRRARAGADAGGGPTASRSSSGGSEGEAGVGEEGWGQFGRQGELRWHDRVKQLIDDLHAFR